MLARLGVDLRYGMWIRSHRKPPQRADDGRAGRVLITPGPSALCRVCTREECARAGAGVKGPPAGVARARKGALNDAMRKTLRTPTMQSSRSRHWTPEEDAVLREHYPGQGWRACQAYLPDRSNSTITGRARKLGLPGPRGPLAAEGCESRGWKSRHTRARKKDNPDRALRRCLGPCGQPFVSEHIGHRMCNACRRHAERIGGDSASFTP